MNFVSKISQPEPGKDPIFSRVVLNKEAIQKYADNFQARSNRQIELAATQKTYDNIQGAIGGIVAAVLSALPEEISIYNHCDQVTEVIESRAVETGLPAYISQHELIKELKRNIVKQIRLEIVIKSHPDFPAVIEAIESRTPFDKFRDQFINFLLKLADEIAGWNTDPASLRQSIIGAQQILSGQSKTPINIQFQPSTSRISSIIYN